MPTRPLAALALALAAAMPAAAQTAAPSLPSSGQPGFFRPARDPALTSISPAPATPAKRREENPGTPVDMAVEIRKVEEARVAEAQMDRAEQEHDRARAEAAAIATSPAPVSAPAVTR
jgi:hypothetical protein